MSVEEQPRHVQFDHSVIDEASLPDALKCRLRVTVINEAPPGQGVPGAPRPSSYQRLTVLCGDVCGDAKIVEVNIDYLSHLSTTTFNRDGDIWYLVHTWTKTWYEGSKTESVFVNLRTGERHSTPYLSLWRGYLSISQDGKLVLIEAGIMASSARQINVIDISDWNNVHLIHYSENWYEGGDCTVHMDGNDIVFIYLFSDNTYKHFYLGDKSCKYEYSSDQQLTKEVVVRRRKNMAKLPDKIVKFGVDQLTNSDLQETKYGCLECLQLSGTIVVSETVVDIPLSSSHSDEDYN